MNQTLYVAGPMTGIADYNYPEFREVAENLTGCGYRVLNPIDVDDLHAAEELNLLTKCAVCYNNQKHDWHWYMRRTIRMMLDADGVALLRGWDRSRGAKVERQLAIDLGMPVAMWHVWALKAREGDKEPPGTRLKKKEV